MDQQILHWSRAIIFVDMDAFFASLEQKDDPSLRGRPVGITNGAQGTCLITCSYEARAFGIHTGMRLKQARRLCPRLIQRPARPRRYAEVSTAIMTALQDITPDVEVFSVDEAFLDVTRCQRFWKKGPEYIARLAKERVYEVAGVNCTVGLSGDKTTAKFAAEQVKPDGFNVIPPWRAREFLKDAPVTALCGIGPGIGAFLAKYGVHNCGDMEKLPISILARRFGDPGRRIWHMCQGADPSGVETCIPAPKSMGHGKVMPPNTREEHVIRTYLMHMSEKLAARLRRHHLQAKHFSIGLRVNSGWLGDKFSCALPTQDSRVIMDFCERIIGDYWRGEGVHGVQVTALDPMPAGQQIEMFVDDPAREDKERRIHAVMDAVNARYGEFALAPAQLLNRSTMPNVIAPAWKPYGHRQIIP
jgi:Nucleotidyltransferase/DNA polymerase involved in DNA repair